MPFFPLSANRGCEIARNIIQYEPDIVQTTNAKYRRVRAFYGGDHGAKRVGKFNIIDIIAVILIVAVVAFGAWKLLGSSGGTAAEDGGMVKVTYVVKCEGVPTELYETCQAHLPSPLMASGALVGGQIESVEMEPYYVLGPDGQWIEDPEHVTLLFTATTETPAGEVMTTKVGDQEVRIGKTDYILKSEYIEFSGGTIVDVQWEGLAEE